MGKTLGERIGHCCKLGNAGAKHQESKTVIAQPEDAQSVSPMAASLFSEAGGVAHVLQR